MLYRSILTDDESIRDTIAALDPSGDGKVNAREFRWALARVLPCITHQQAWTMLRTISENAGGGDLSVHTLLESLQVRFASTYSKPASPDAQWVPKALRKTKIFRQTTSMEIEEIDPNSEKRSGSKALSEFFTAKDSDNSGYLEKEEFVKAIGQLPYCASWKRQDLEAVAEYCDLLENGRINYLEFLNAFNLEAKDTTLGQQLHEDLLEGIYRVLYFEYKTLITQALEQYIVPGRLRCSREEFAAALSAVNATAQLLSEEQLQVLVDTLTTDDDGLFDYSDYFASFEVIDTDFDYDDENVVEG